MPPLPEPSAVPFLAISVVMAIATSIIVLGRFALVLHTRQRFTGLCSAVFIPRFFAQLLVVVPAFVLPFSWTFVIALEEHTPSYIVCVSVAAMLQMGIGLQLYANVVFGQPTVGDSNAQPPKVEGDGTSGG